MTWKLILALVVGFCISSAVGAVLVPYLRKIKAGQAIREDGPTWHMSKTGTPTMGGLMFIIAVTVVCLTVGFSCMANGEWGHIFILVFGLVFGAIGFLDDYEKLRHKQNLGLSAKMKFLLQLLAATCFLLLLRFTGYLSPNLYIPFWNTYVPVSEPLYFIFAAFVIVGTVNAVNITDGVDGLAAGTLLGNALGLGSGVAYAGVFLVNTEPEGDAMSSYFLGQVAGALIGLPFLSGETDFSFVPMVCIFALGVFQLGLSYVLIARGIATTPPMTASLVTAIEPILTPVWVALAYGERLSGFSLAGAVLVLCSVVWFNTRGRKAL